MSDNLKELDAFIGKWPDSPDQNKATFIRLKNFLAALPETVLEYVPREGVTYSLRARHANQKNRPLFAMADVIEDDPRWLSVCFFGELITDPEDAGEYAPGGLFGEDAICFDIMEFDESAVAYVEARLAEAHANAAKG